MQALAGQGESCQPVPRAPGHDQVFFALVTFGSLREGGGGILRLPGQQKHFAEIGVRISLDDRTVTVLRCYAAPVAKGTPHSSQNLAPSLFSWPQLVQTSTLRA